MKQFDASNSKNQGFRNVLVVSGVFSRFVWAVPMTSKSQEATASAFKGIMEASGRKPAEVDSDGGAEFSGVFDDLLEEEGIAHRDKRPGHTNALAVVDSLIR